MGVQGIFRLTSFLEEDKEGECHLELQCGMAVQKVSVAQNCLQVAGGPNNMLLIPDLRVSCAHWRWSSVGLGRL